MFEFIKSYFSKIVNFYLLTSQKQNLGELNLETKKIVSKDGGSKAEIKRYKMKKQKQLF